MPDDSPLVQMARDDHAALARHLRAMAHDRRRDASIAIVDADALERAAVALEAPRPRASWPTVAPSDLRDRVVVPPCRPAVPQAREAPLPPAPPRSAAARGLGNGTKAKVLAILRERGASMTLVEIAEHFPISLQGVGVALRELFDAKRVERRGPQRGPGVRWAIPGAADEAPSAPALPEGSTPAPVVVGAGPPSAEARALELLAMAGHAGAMPTPLRDAAGLEVDAFQRLIDDLIKRKLIARVVAGGVRYIILEPGLAEFRRVAPSSTPGENEQ